ncbi:uncharacterized protein LOC119948085 [Tachyglossus aculeatus]|uniref:uncharacterized protein LOC119948085 n=1 Tax=Tachyglossus aculeatus TaxID=9261 RepID=UPI0018F2C78D|nr:uncharacterized protein LOC119948085 [Tachyglossus aculeatus]
MRSILTRWLLVIGMTEIWRQGISRPRTQISPKSWNETAMRMVWNNGGITRWVGGERKNSSNWSICTQNTKAFEAVDWLWLVKVLGRLLMQGPWGASLNQILNTFTQDLGNPITVRKDQLPVIQNNSTFRTDVDRDHRDICWVGLNQKKQLNYTLSERIRVEIPWLPPWVRKGLAENAILKKRPLWALLKDRSVHSRFCPMRETVTIWSIGAFWVSWSYSECFSYSRVWGITELGTGVWNLVIETNLQSRNQAQGNQELGEVFTLAFQTASQEWTQLHLLRAKMKELLEKHSEMMGQLFQIVPAGAWCHDAQRIVFTMLLCMQREVYLQKGLEELTHFLPSKSHPVRDPPQCPGLVGGCYGKGQGDSIQVCRQSGPPFCQFPIGIVEKGEWVRLACTWVETWNGTHISIWSSETCSPDNPGNLRDSFWCPSRQKRDKNWSVAWINLTRGSRYLRDGRYAQCSLTGRAIKRRTRAWGEWGHQTFMTGSWWILNNSCWVNISGKVIFPALGIKGPTVRGNLTPPSLTSKDSDYLERVLRAWDNGTQTWEIVVSQLRMAIEKAVSRAKEYGQTCQRWKEDWLFLCSSESLLINIIHACVLAILAGIVLGMGLLILCKY